MSLNDETEELEALEEGSLGLKFYRRLKVVFVFNFVKKLSRSGTCKLAK